MATLEQKLKPWKFANVVGDRNLKGSGLNRGDEVFILSTKDVAFKRDDPYLKRTLMIVAKVKGDNVLMPSNKNEYKAIVIDPRSLDPIGKERGEVLMAALDDSYNG